MKHSVFVWRVKLAVWFRRWDRKHRTTLKDRKALLSFAVGEFYHPKNVWDKSWLN